MIPPRWTLGHLVAVVELACGVLAAVWLVGLGIGADTGSPLDRSFPFLLGAAVGIGLAGMALRSWRTANREAQQMAAPPRRPEPTTYTPPPPPPPARLSPEGEREVARIVAALAAAGVFAPRVPEPEQLREAVADQGEPVTAQVVLAAMMEADWHRPGFRVSDHSANLAFHPSHAEQLPDVLRAQAEDMVRLAGGEPAGVSATVDVGDPDDAGRVPTRIRLAAGGAERVLDYAGRAKYLSTVLHVWMARALRERGTGLRLAWLWSDQGVWLSGLRDGGVERLDAELGPAAEEGWAWVDEESPMAAGDPSPTSA